MTCMPIWQSIRMLVLPVAAALFLAGCQTVPPDDDNLESRGEDLFFNETFAGNGRTCGTCHRAEDNFGLSPAFVATLASDDPLFVSENIPGLGNNFENAELIRKLALILENQDGFDDLAANFNQRGVPHTLALRVSIDSAAGPRTGWAGDGAPGDGTLRSFAVGAVVQHFPLTTNRIAGVDFRLPTEDELDALEAFQLSLGRQQELELPLPLKGDIASRGQAIFLDNALGKCNACHFNAGANANPALFGDVGNLNFDTGVEALPDQPADLSGQLNPPDDGFGNPGNGEFNTPVLVEAADTGPFFHNNSVETIEGAVAFYNGDAFNNSSAGQLVIGATGSGINLDGTQVVAVAAFLRVINGLENIRESRHLIKRSEKTTKSESTRRSALIKRALAEVDDAIQVLVGGGLHPDAVAELNEARRSLALASRSHTHRYLKDALAALSSAHDLLIAS